MIRLNNTPIEGSTVKVNLVFRDSAGIFYVPTKVSYTLLALNNDKESWSVVEDNSLTPASNIVLTLSDIKTIEGTTLQRKVMVYWSAFVDNEYNDFVDEIIFDVTPKPYVPNPPSPRPEEPIYVQITDSKLQLGTIGDAPVQPVFLLRTNLPVRIDSAMARIIDNEGQEIICNLSVNTAGGNLTVSINTELNYEKAYVLKLIGLVSSVNGYVMKEPFELSFVTCKRDTPPYVPVIQPLKEVAVTRNGTYNIAPDNGYDAVELVKVTVDIPENPILLYCYHGTTQFYFTREVTESGTYKVFINNLTVNEFEVTVNDGDIMFEYDDNLEIVIRDISGDILK